jgi:flagellar biosynthesis anti-sigma factor FlgM
LKALLDTVPDIRQQRVESLRQAIVNGSFKVSLEHIAEAMLASGA